MRGQWRHAVALSGALLATSAGTTAARAQSDEELLELGRYQYERGIELYRKGDYQGARDAFEESYRLTPYPIVLYNLAITHAALGDPVAAEEGLAKVVASPGSLSAARVAAAEQALTQQRARLGSLRVDCEIGDAEVWVDGAPRGSTPLAEPVRVKSGNVTVELQKLGYAAPRRRVAVRPGATVDVPCALEPTETGWIGVRSQTPGAEVLLDGDRVGTTPLDRSFSVPAGSHTLELRRAGYRPAKRQVDVKKGDSLELDLPLDEDPSASARGVVVIRSEVDDVEIVIDGRPRGRGGAPIELAAGPHRFVAESGGYRPFTRDIDVPAGDRLYVQVELEPTPEMRAAHVASATAVRTWSWLLTAGGVAVLAGNGVFLAVNEGSRDDALAELEAYRKETNTQGAPCFMNPPGECETRLNSILDDENAATDRRVVGFVGLAIGGVLAGAGVLGFLLGDDPHRFDPPSQERDFRAGAPPSYRLRPTLAASEEAVLVGTTLAF